MLNIPLQYIFMEVTTNKSVGKIRVAGTGRGLGYPKVEGFVVIPSWSRGAAPWKKLSPFYIGPVHFEENGEQKVAKNYENFWQGSKVWKNVNKQRTKFWQWPAECHVDENNQPNENWHKWNKALLSNDGAVRRPNGKNVPLYAYWNNEQLDVIEARKKIYIPYLQAAYRAHPVYKELLALVYSGLNVILMDACNVLYNLYPQGIECTKEQLLKLIETTNVDQIDDGVILRKEGFEHAYFGFGHGLVINLTLMEDLEVLQKLNENK